MCYFDHIYIIFHSCYSLYHQTITITGMVKGGTVLKLFLVNDNNNNNNNIYSNNIRDVQEWHSVKAVCGRLLLILSPALLAQDYWPRWLFFIIVKNVTAFYDFYFDYYSNWD